MSVDNAAAFFAQIAKDKALCEKLSTVQEQLQQNDPAGLEELIRIASEAGLDFTPQHLAEFLKAHLTEDGRLSDKDLGQVAGGVTIVNPQMTDSVTQTNVKILGDAPGMSMGNLYTATAIALGHATRSYLG